MSDKSICPVCGSMKSYVPLSEYDCDVCGFANAFVRYFASAQGNRQWLASVEKARGEWLKKQKPQPEICSSLVAASGAIAWCSTNEKKIYIAFGKDALEEVQDAIGFSSSERNYAVLYSNGKVQVYGEENDFRQKETSKWHDIISVTVAPNCTYGVTSDGQVLVAGIPVAPKISSWIQIQKIECGSGFAAGLRDDGRVILSGIFLGETKNALVRNWIDMIDIKAGKDILIGLRSDGTVSFAGKKDDSRAEVKKWHDIVAIAADNAYVYGLTKEGRIVMAGSVSGFLDRGRSAAKNCENIISISCNQTGIAAVSKEGDLLFFGTIAGDIEAVRDIWQEHIKKAIV